MKNSHHTLDTDRSPDFGLGRWCECANEPYPLKLAFPAAFAQLVASPSMHRYIIFESFCERWIGCERLFSAAVGEFFN